MYNAFYVTVENLFISCNKLLSKIKLQMHSILNPLSNLVQRNVCIGLPALQNAMRAKLGAQSSYFKVEGHRFISVITRREREPHFALRNESIPHYTRSIPKYTTTANSTKTIGKNIDIHVKSAKAALKKIKRKNTGSQKLKSHITPGKDAWSIVGYTTAESYDLYNLAKNLAIQVMNIRLGLCIRVCAT